MKKDDLRTMLATSYTPSQDNAPNPEGMREKSREYTSEKDRLKLKQEIERQQRNETLSALLRRCGAKSKRVDSRYTEAYGPHDVMLNIDGINIYTKTMITFEEDLAGQIYVDREELKVRSIEHCAMLEEDAMHLVTEADGSAHILDINQNSAVSGKQRGNEGPWQNTNNSLESRGP